MEDLYEQSISNFEKVLEPDSLTIEDCVNYSEYWDTLNFKDMPGKREQGQHEVKTDILNLQQYYKGTVVKWCFPFRVVNKKRVESDFKEPQETGPLYERNMENCANNDHTNLKNLGPGLLYNSCLLVGDDFIYLTDSNVVNRIHGGIVDCELFDFYDESDPQYNYPNLLLIIQRDGTLFSLFPQIYAYPLKQTNIKIPNRLKKTIKNTYNITTTTSESDEICPCPTNEMNVGDTFHSIQNNNTYLSSLSESHIYNENSVSNSTIGDRNHQNSNMGIGGNASNDDNDFAYNFMNNYYDSNPFIHNMLHRHNNREIMQNSSIYPTINNNDIYRSDNYNENDGFNGIADRNVNDNATNHNNFTHFSNLPKKSIKGHKPKPILTDTEPYPKIKHFMKLNPSNDWKIIKNPKNSKHFILADFKSGNIIFFKFTGIFCKFKFIEKVSFDNCKIQSCYFLPDKNNKLFISTIVANRMVHYFIEWGNDSLMKVYKLKHLATYSVKNSIPIGPDNILLCLDKKILLISTKQIICGDTNFIEYKNNIMWGIRSWFDDPILTKKLIYVINKKKILPVPLNTDDQCTIVLTYTCVLYAIFLSGTDRRLYHFSLGRFKQLRFAYSDKKQSDAKIDSHMIIALIFNRTVRLELDLNSVEFVPPLSTKLPNRKPTECRTNISSNSDENNNTITHVTPKNEVILSGSSSISQLSGSSIIPIRETKTVGRFKKSFRNYNHIQIVNSIDSRGEKIPYLHATRNKEVNSYFAFNNVEQTFEIQNNIEHECDHLFQKKYDTHTLKVTKHEVICIGDNSETILFSSDFNIDGVCSLHNGMVLWNLHHKKVWFFHNIAHVDQITWEENKEFHDFIKDEPEFSFFLYCNTYTHKEMDMVLFTPKCLVVQPWEKDEVHHLRDKVINDLRIIYKGNFNYFTVLHNGLFCIKEYREMAPCILYGSDLKTGKAFTIDHGLLNRDEFDIDLTIKPLYDNCSIALICTDNLYLITCNEKMPFVDNFISDGYSNNYWEHHIISLEEIKLPIIDSYKNSYLLDVDIYEKDGEKIICLLYDTGLQCIEALYLTWNRNSYLLQNTRSKNKLFTHLENLNRILVTNCDTKGWYLLNIQNGKIKTLNDEVLKVTDAKIQNIVRFPNNCDNENINRAKHCSLLVMFDTMIKCVNLNTIQNDIEVVEMCQHSFDGILHNEYSIYADTVTLLERQTDKEIFHKIRLNMSDKCIEFLHNFSLKIKSSTKHFLTGINFIVLSGESENKPLLVVLYHIYNTYGALTEDFLLKNALIGNLRYPPIQKLLRIANDVMLVIYDDNDNKDIKSSLNIIKLTDDIKWRSHKRREKLFYEDRVKKYDDPDVVCFWSYMVNSWYHYFENIQGEYNTKRSYLYTDYIHLPLFGYGIDVRNTCISLDKKVLDAKYVNNRLFVLCHDQTVLQFGPNEDLFDYKRGVLTIEQNNEADSLFTKNGGYVIPDDESYLDDRNVPYSGKYFQSIDPWGRLILENRPYYSSDDQIL